MKGLESVIYSLTKQTMRLPGIAETYVALCDLVDRAPSFDSAWRRLPGWIEDLDRSRSVWSHSPQSRILFFSVLPTHVDYSLAFAVLLAARGVFVDFAWLAHATYGSDIPPTRAYEFWLRTSKVVGSRVKHSRLCLHDLREVDPCPISTTMRDIAASQALNDISYVLLKERIHVDSDPGDQQEFEFRLARNLDAIARVATLLKERPYDRIILISGGILEFGAVQNYAENLGLPISSFEVLTDGHLLVSNGPSVLNIDLSDGWKCDEPHIMTASRRARVQRTINNRQKPSSKPFALEGYQIAGPTSADQTRTQLALQQGKPVILICPNVPFDAAFYVPRSRNFPAMWDWLVKTLNYLAQRSDCQVVVRSHPAEVYYHSNENTADLIREFFPSLPAHITVVPPEVPISTYSLMDIADLGLVYASTTGLEIPLRGVPVICGITTHYNGKGFTLDPDTPEEYFSLIDRVLHNPKAFRLTPRQVELAWCYADLFFNEWPKSFPWAAGPRLWRDLKTWPITRMLSPEGEEKFGRTLDILLGREPMFSVTNQEGS